MNKAILTGNLAGDVESRTTSGGIAQCTFRLAVQRRYAAQGGERIADFLTIVCWRQLAENCAKYLSKGRKVLVEGSIQTRSYDAQDGTKRYVTEIVADNVEFLGSAEKGAQEAASPAERISNAYDRSMPAQQQDAHQMGFTEVEDDELPF